MGHFSERSPGRRLLRKETTRRELLRAGRKLFSEKGLYESRIEDLTLTAGIAKGTLYLYFRNKEALVLDVASQGYDELRDHVLRRVGSARTTREMARAMARAHLEFFVENPDFVRIFHQVRGILKFDRPEWRGLRAPLDGHIRFLADLLARAAPPSRRSPSARRRIAIQIYGNVSGVVSVYTVLESHPDVRKLWPLLSGALSLS